METQQLEASTSRASILEEFDYDQKIRVLSLNKRIAWFIENKPTMSQNEKWDAFYDMCEDYSQTKTQMLGMVNRAIRARGLSWDKTD